MKKVLRNIYSHLSGILQELTVFKAFKKNVIFTHFFHIIFYFSFKWSILKGLFISNVPPCKAITLCYLYVVIQACWCSVLWIIKTSTIWFYPKWLILQLTDNMLYYPWMTLACLWASNLWDCWIVSTVWFKQ